MQYISTALRNRKKLISSYSSNLQLLRYCEYGMFSAVRKGSIPGIYQTWTECQEVIKGFSTLGEAEAFMNE